MSCLSAWRRLSATLSNVYAKIGARGRTEATAFAITHGLAKA
jgi:DNA-binding CsgD family transcriptional regulator